MIFFCKTDEKIPERVASVYCGRLCRGGNAHSTRMPPAQGFFLFPVTGRFRYLQMMIAFGLLSAVFFLDFGRLRGV